MYWFSGDRWKSSLPTLRRSPQRARRSHSLWPPSRLIRKTEPSCRRLANSLLSNITLFEILKAQHFKPYPLRTVLVSRFLSLFFSKDKAYRAVWEIQIFSREKWVRWKKKLEEKLTYLDNSEQRRFDHRQLRCLPSSIRGNAATRTGQATRPGCEQIPAASSTRHSLRG